MIKIYKSEASIIYALCIEHYDMFYVPIKFW